LADNWFAEFLGEVQNLVQKVQRRGRPKVKVAILDTGIREQDEEIRVALNSGAIQLQNCKGFPDTDARSNEFNPLSDPKGHGTHCACVLLKTAPNIDLFVARIFDDQEEIASANNYQGTVKANLFVKLRANFDAGSGVGDEGKGGYYIAFVESAQRGARSEKCLVAGPFQPNTYIRRCGERRSEQRNSISSKYGYCVLRWRYGWFW